MVKHIVYVHNGRRPICAQAKYMEELRKEDPRQFLIVYHLNPGHRKEYFRLLTCNETDAAALYAAEHTDADWDAVNYVAPHVFTQ
jgi:hypothetical protein